MSNDDDTRWPRTPGLQAAMWRLVGHGEGESLLESPDRLHFARVTGIRKEALAESIKLALDSHGPLLAAAKPITDHLALITPAPGDTHLSVPIAELQALLSAVRKAEGVAR